MIVPPELSSKLPAVLVALAAQTVMFSRSHHFTRRGLPLPPRTMIMRSSVTTTSVLSIGAFVTGAAITVGVVGSHENSRPSWLWTVTR